MAAKKSEGKLHVMSSGLLNTGGKIILLVAVVVCTMRSTLVNLLGLRNLL